MNIGVFGWTPDRPLREAVTAAGRLREPGDTLFLCLPAGRPAELEQASQLGADCLVTIQGGGGELAGLLAVLVQELALGALVLPSSYEGRGAAAALAQRLGGDCTLDCVGLGRGEDGAIQAVRPAFASHALASFSIRANLCTLVPRDRHFPPALPQEGRARLLTLDCPGQTAPRLPEEIEPWEKDRLDQAEIVVVGGRGITCRKDLELVQGFTQALGGAFGATRPLVMSGLAPSSLLIGQSGRTVAPRLCITVGVSGSTPFLAGVSPASKILAVNNNPDANIFLHADYGIRADYRELLPRLRQAWEQEGGPGKALRPGEQR